MVRGWAFVPGGGAGKFHSFSLQECHRNTTSKPEARNPAEP